MKIAWELAIKLRPTLNLYDADGHHPPSFEAILSVYVLVGALTDEVSAAIPAWYQIKDIDGETVELMNIDTLMPCSFGKIAEQTLREYGML